jgi:hypothetical protein
MPATIFLPPTNLRFRGISDSLATYHLEGSECCLVHADNPLSRTHGVYLNPRVRVGYNGEAYLATNPSKGSWLSNWEILRGLWENRLRRWFPMVYFKEWMVRWRVSTWEGREGRGEKEHGKECLVNEMQVLAENGWAHV